MGETQTSPEPARAGITTCTLPLTLPLFFLYILTLGSGVLGGGKPPSRLLISPTHRGASGRNKNLSRAGRNKHKYLNPTPTLLLFFLSILTLGSGVLGGGKPPSRLLISPTHRGACGRDTNLSGASKGRHNYLHPIPHIATLLSLYTCLRIRGIGRG